MGWHIPRLTPSSSSSLLPVRCQQCHIQTCNADYVGSTSPGPSSPVEPLPGVDYCSALRAFSLCTQRTARSCRGDLVYHSAVFRIKELFLQHSCSSEGPTAPSSDRAPWPQPGTPEACSYRWATGPPRTYVHCGLFGDPHLRTFKDEFQTCRVQGAWPLIDNQYLSVQVTNVPVTSVSRATATSKITVIIKAFPGCTEQRVYQATSEDLPAAFSDGTEGAGGLRVEEKPGKVEIRAPHADATIAIRRIGRYLTFAIRLPADAASSGAQEGDALQLCLHGCPRDELIQGHQLPLPQWTLTGEAAMERCRRLLLHAEDAYLQSCVFDLLTTGDPDFSLAARGAQEDLQALGPGARIRWDGETAAGSSDGTPRVRVYVMCSVIILWTLLGLS
ncbi:hypothetical protein FKM82_015033 [Ascaphus truei]